ncbi:hypothetical protein [Streptomyces scabiei]|uniref:hypothetical protein n=1 Tax=Streptomyces scabiei TaxID=1930 RepID=UPI0029A80F2F|nr:hypothetical protein [Streptomyces scabiei]MDX3522632.1 hypothetical protein [Streptomyces scabiei]
MRYQDSVMGEGMGRILSVGADNTGAPARLLPQRRPDGDRCTAKPRRAARNLRLGDAGRETSARIASPQLPFPDSSMYAVVIDQCPLLKPPHILQYAP